ncbi:MAG: hypothetical protein WC516_06890 [Patescibacteria group bacterium]|jgi:hypothetical protein
MKLKRSQIKALSDSKKSIFKDILRIQRSILHHKRMRDWAKTAFRGFTDVAMKDAIGEDWYSSCCSLCCKYRGARCVGCPLFINNCGCSGYKKIYGGDHYYIDTPWVMLNESMTWSVFVENENKYMLPALDKVLDYYYKLFEEASDE